MEITEVRLHKVEGQEPVKAFASVTLDDELVISKIRVIEGTKGYFAAMPSERGKDGKYHDITFPITGALRDKIQVAVMDKYEKSGAE